MQIKPNFRTLVDLFNEALANVKPLDKTCLEIIRVSREEKLSFGQLRNRSRAFACWLIQTARIGPADKVAITSKNSIDWDVALWGTVLAGAIPVLVDPERGSEGVINHLRHTEAKILIMADDYGDEDSRRELQEFCLGSNLALLSTGDIPSVPPANDNIRLLDDVRSKIEPNTTAVILCTSGTTGDPREVELTHANLAANIRGSIQKVKITDRDRLGHILPPHHSFGLTVGKFLPFSVGATNIYTNKYRDIPELIRAKEISIFVATPALYTVLAKKIDDNIARQKQNRPLIKLLDRYLPKIVGKILIRKLGWTRLRFLLSGAAPMPRWVLDVLWKRGIRLYEGYGTTENSPVYGFNDSIKKLGAVGKPISTIFVKIVDENNHTLLPGEKGEICLGGPCIMKGYYKNPTATDAVIDTDEKGMRWLHTGDLGYLDKDGNLSITGRKKYLIVLPGGKNVNPELVESVLSQARFVKEILIVPTKQENSTGITQETIRAIVLPALDAIEAHTNVRHADLQKEPQKLKSLVWQSIRECQHKNRQLSHFEKIGAHHLEIRIEEFQKTSTGKIKREAYINL